MAIQLFFKRNIVICFLTLLHVLHMLGTSGSISKIRVMVLGELGSGGGKIWILHM